MFIKDIINTTKGELVLGINDYYVESFSIDSRALNKGEMFISIIGDKFNGNNFIRDSFKKGACGVIYQGDIDDALLNDYNDRIFIKVNDTVKALQDMASFKRNQYDIPVVAITGSVGKTSTKDIVASVMKTKYKCLSTIGNLNNHIGLPLTLLKLKDHNAMCIEIGMNHLGELSRLTNILKPTIAVITNVGTAHIGNLGSRENILKAKLEILEGLQENGKLIINNDNDLLHDWYEKQNKYNIITYGIENQSNFIANNLYYDLNYSNFLALGNNEKYNVKVNIPGKHFVYNSLCAIAVGNLLNIDAKSIEKGINNFELTKGRMEERHINNNITLLVDCYNANYDSMACSLDVLGKYSNRKIAVLGDMLELGEYSLDLHKKVGDCVNRNNIDILITVGELSKHISNEFKGKNVYQCVNNLEAIKILKKILKPDDIVLFKASNSMNFIEIVQNL